jgi:hypothetical protein
MSNKLPPMSGAGAVNPSGDRGDRSEVLPGALPATKKLRAAQREAQPLSAKQRREGAETLVGDPRGFVFGDPQ